MERFVLIFIGKMIENIVFNALGVFFVLFLFWKRLKEDYASGIIFTTAIYSILGTLAGYFIASKFFPAWWFYVEAIFLMLGFLLGVLRYKLRFFEVLEALVISYIPWIAFIFLKDSIQSQNIASLFVFLYFLILFITFFVLDKHYKRFVWYKSGRIGFSGLTILGALFLARALVGAFNLPVLSFVGESDAIVSAIIAFVSFLMIYNLSRSTS